MTTAPPGCHRLDRGQRGAALLLILVIFMTVGLAMLFRSNQSQEDWRFARDERTDQALQQAKAALIGYAATYRDTRPNQVFGYLPCPDLIGNGEIAVGCGQAGVADGKPAIGLLPYKSLGLADLRDQDGICLWYVVGGRFKAHSTKYEPMNWDTQGQFSVREAATIAAASPTILAAPNDAAGGAAAVIIASGAPLPGQNRSAGAQRCAVNQAEVAAYLDGGYNFDTTATIDLNHGPARNIAGTLTNNDRMVWISPKEIFTAVGRRADFSGPSPDGHINRLIDDIAGALSNAAALPQPKNANPPGTTVTTGDVPDVVVTMPEYLAHWRNQMRYVKCNATTQCLTLNAAPCAGILMFGGQRALGGPRSTVDVPSLFEDDRVSLWNGFTTTVTGNAAYQPGTPSLDVTRCLNPLPAVLSFANNIATLSPKVVETFSEGRTVVVNATTRTLTLGDADLSSSQENPDTGVDYSAGLLFGCGWFASSAAFSTRLVAYFKFKIDNFGNGFTLALADADPARNPDINMCGDGGNSLGYSGLPNNGAPIPGLSLRGIQFPKIGIEFDTNDDRTGDPDDRHLAQVFWQNPIDDDKDNQHGLGINPAGSPAIASGSILRSSAVQHARVEITRSRPSATQTRLQITAWVLRDSAMTTAFNNTSLLTGFDDSAVDSSDFLKVTHDITVSDVTIGVEALRNLWVGFTNSTGSNAQVIQISDFILNAQ